MYGSNWCGQIPHREILNSWKKIGSTEILKFIRNIVKDNTKSFLSKQITEIMDSEKTISEYREKLENLGRELSTIQYDFKIKNKPSEKYWGKRIQEFCIYHKKAIEYFTQVYSLMSLTNEEQSGMFLLRISKLGQLGEKLLEDMENIKQNPATMNLKNQQQSRWSIEQREKLIKSNKNCLNHEKRMNVFFKEFFEKYLQGKTR